MKLKIMAKAIHQPPIKPPPVVFKENWKEKEERLRSSQHMETFQAGDSSLYW